MSLRSLALFPLPYTQYIKHNYALATLFNNMHSVINDYRPHQVRLSF